MKLPMLPSSMGKPAKVYLVLGALCLVYGAMHHMGSTALFTKAVFIAVWTALIVFVGKQQGLKTVAWVLVFVPFAYMWLSGKGIMEGMDSKSCATCKSTHKSCKQGCAKAGGDTAACDKKCKSSFMKCYGSSCSS